MASASACELAGQLGQPGEILLAGPPGRIDRLLQPPDLIGGGPGGPGEPAKPAGDLRGPRVGLAHPGPGLFHRQPRRFLGPHRHREPLGGQFTLLLGFFQARGGTVRGRPDLQQALLPGRTAGRPVWPQQITVPGDHAQGRGRPQQVGRLLQGGGHHDPAQQLGHGGPQLIGGLDQLQRGPGPRRQRLTTAAGRPRREGMPGLRVTGDHQPSGADPGFAQHGQNRDGGIQVGDRDRVGGRAQRRGDRDLGTVRHGQRLGERADDPAEPAVGGEQIR